MTDKTLVVAVLPMLALAWLGCPADRRPEAFRVTVPNGSSPASAHAPHAPINDSDEMRRSWNHGNGVLWVLLPAGSVIAIDEPARDDSPPEIRGYSRVKFGWWRGARGKFTIEGHRLDGHAQPLRYFIRPESYGDIGFIPSYLYFPTTGYWEITGRIGDQSLTFVVRVQAATS